MSLDREATRGSLPPPTGPTARSARTLLLGLGNPILSDDAVGLLVTRRVRELLGEGEAEVQEASLGGLELLDQLTGYRRAVLVDAMVTPGGRPGAVYRLLPGSLPTTARLAAVHEVDLATALAMGRELGIDLPDQVVIFAIEVEDPWTFGDNLSPAVEAAVEQAARRVLNELNSDP